MKNLVFDSSNINYMNNVIRTPKTGSHVTRLGRGDEDYIPSWLGRPLRRRSRRTTTILKLIFVR